MMTRGHQCDEMYDGMTARPTSIYAIWGMAPQAAADFDSSVRLMCVVSDGGVWCAPASQPARQLCASYTRYTTPHSSLNYTPSRTTGLYANFNLAVGGGFTWAKQSWASHVNNYY